MSGERELYEFQQQQQQHFQQFASFAAKADVACGSNNPNHRCTNTSSSSRVEIETPRTRAAGAGTIARARSQLMDSFEFVPEEDKFAYLKAVETVPHLVELESNPEHYLAFAGYDPWKAALRLAKYWKRRLEIFGDESAFLPLTLSGAGALSKDDIDVLNSGFMVALPADQHGRAVLFHDRARLTKREYLDPRKRLKCLFYVLSTIAESEQSRKMGLVVIGIYTDKTRNQTIDNQLNTDMASLITKEYFPFRPFAYHIIMMSQKPVIRKVVPMLIQMLQYINVLDQVKVYIHNAACADLLVREHGFQLEGIPKSPLGGMYTIGCFKNWLDDRRRRDARVYYSYIHPTAPGAPYYARSTSNNNTSDTSNPALGVVCAAADSSPIATTTIAAAAIPYRLQDDSEEEILRKKRELEAAAARRKRARKQNAIKEMQEQVEILSRQNQTLQEENNELETRLRDANRCIILNALGAAEQQQQQRRRQRTN